MTDHARSVLWARVQALMASKWGGENQNRLSREAKVGVATISRMKTAGTSIGLDVIEKVACALGVEAWQLICPEAVFEAGESLSPLAVDLGRSLDRIQDSETRKRAYAIASQVLLFGAAPAHQASQTLDTQPTQPPLQVR